MPEQKHRKPTASDALICIAIGVAAWFAFRGLAWVMPLVGTMPVEIKAALIIAVAIIMSNNRSK